MCKRGELTHTYTHTEHMTISLQWMTSFTQVFRPNSSAATVDFFPPSCSPSSEIQQSSAELIGLTSKRLISPYTDKTLLNITFHAWHYNLVLIMQLVLRLWTHNISKELVQALKCFPAVWAWRYILRFSGKSCVFWGGGEFVLWGLWL